MQRQVETGDLEGEVAGSDYREKWLSLVRKEFMDQDIGVGGRFQAGRVAVQYLQNQDLISVDPSEEQSEPVVEEVLDHVYDQLLMQGYSLEIDGRTIGPRLNLLSAFGTSLDSERQLESRLEGSETQGSESEITETQIPDLGRYLPAIQKRMDLQRPGD